MLAAKSIRAITKRRTRKVGPSQELLRSGGEDSRRSSIRSNSSRSSYGSAIGPEEDVEGAVGGLRSKADDFYGGAREKTNNFKEKMTDYPGGGFFTRGWENVKGIGTGLKQKITGAKDYVVNAPENASNWARKKFKETTDEALLTGKRAVDDTIGGIMDKAKNDLDDIINGVPGETEIEKQLRRSGQDVGGKWKDLSLKNKASKGLEIGGATFAASMILSDLLPGVASIIEASKDPVAPVTNYNYETPEAPSYVFGGGSSYVPQESASYSKTPTGQTSDPYSTIEDEVNNPLNKAGMGKSMDFSTVNSRKRGYGQAFSIQSEMPGGVINYENRRYLMPSIRTRLNKSGNGISLDSLLRQTGLINK